MWDLSGIKLWLVSKTHPFQVKKHFIVLNLTAMAWDVGPCLSRQSCAIASELISDLCSAPAKPPKYLSWLLQKFSASFPETLKTWTAGREAELAKLVGCFFFFNVMRQPYYQIDGIGVTPLRTEDEASLLLNLQNQSAPATDHCSRLRFHFIWDPWNPSWKCRNILMSTDTALETKHFTPETRE